MNRLAIILCGLMVFMGAASKKCPDLPPIPQPTPCPECPVCPTCPPPCPTPTPGPEPTPTPTPTPTPEPSHCDATPCPPGVENISVYVHAKGDAGGSSGSSWAAVLDATIKASSGWCRCPLPKGECSTHPSGDRTHCPVPDQCIDVMSGPPVFESRDPLPGHDTGCVVIETDNPWMPKITGWCYMRIYPQKLPNVRTICEIDEAKEGPAVCWQEG